MNAKLISSTVSLAALLTPCVVAATPESDHYAIAAGHYALQQWRLALDEFDSLLQRYPEHKKSAEAGFFAAESLLQLGQFKDAASRFQQVFGHHQDHPLASRALFRWGECAHLAGDHAAALRALTEFQAKYPDNGLQEFALPYLGRVLIDDGQDQAGRQAYENALERFPDGQLADECLMQIAIGAYRAQQFETAQARLRRLVRDFPDSKYLPEAAYWSGMILFHQRSYERAAGSFENVTQIDDNHSRVPASFYFAGESWRRQGNDAKASAAFQALLDRKDLEWADDALAGLVRISLTRQEFDQLDRHIGALEEQFPTSSRIDEARQLYGESLIKREAYARAIQVFEGLTAGSSDKPSPSSAKEEAINLYLLAVAYLGNDRPRDAQDALSGIHVEALPPTFVDHVRLARASAASQLGDTKTVVDQMRQALESVPSSALADRCHYTLVRALVKSNQFEAAEAELRVWDGRDSSTPALRRFAARQIAEHAFRRRQYRLALRHFASLVSPEASANQNAESLAGVAWCHFQLEDYASAVAAVDQLSRDYPQSKEARQARLMRARSLQRLGRHDAAQAAYREIVSDPYEGRDFVIATLAVAEFSTAHGNAARAESLLKTLVDHPAAQDQRDHVLYQLGWALMRQGREEEAIPLFQRVHREHPSSRYWADATYRIAERAFESADHRLAEQMLTQIHALPPARLDSEIHPYALHLSARLAAAKRSWPEVLEPLERVLADYPASPVVTAAHFWLAEAHFNMKQYEAADQHLKSIANSRGNREDWRATALLRKLQTSVALKNWGEIEQPMRLLQTEYPQFERMYEANFSLGRAYAARGAFQRARRQFDRVIRDPHGRFTSTAAMAQWMIGETYLHQSQFEEAVKAYLKVETLYDFPQWRSAALLQAGKCCERLGRAEDAGRLYRRLIEELPSSSYHAAAKSRLRMMDPTEHGLQSSEGDMLDTQHSR